MPRTPVRSTLALLASAALAAPAAAATLPPTSGSITFEEFQDAGGHFITSCDKTLAGVGSSNCSGLSVYTGGPLGDGFHVSAHKSGTGAITSPLGAPTATTTLDMSGGDGISGAGLGEVNTRLEYYVTVLPLGALGTSGLKIPLTFADAGSIRGTGANAELIGEADTALTGFTGDIVVDGHLSSFDDGLDDTVDGGTLNESYAVTHHVVFDFGEGDAVAKVTLAAICSAGALTASGMSASCTASADPFVGFDQAAFDAAMGGKTFNLSDAFRIVLSPGLEETGGGVPEPAQWMLMIAGFGLAGAALRRRQGARQALGG